MPWSGRINNISLIISIRIEKLLNSHNYRSTPEIRRFHFSFTVPLKGSKGMNTKITG